MIQSVKRISFVCIVVSSKFNMMLSKNHKQLTRLNKTHTNWRKKTTKVVKQLRYDDLETTKLKIDKQ